MPICVLLIDNNASHAQVVVSALADPWLGWQVDVATSVQAGLQRVRQGGVVIVICRHQLQDGTAFDVLEVLQDFLSLNGKTKLMLTGFLHDLLPYPLPEKAPSSTPCSPELKTIPTT
jgi:CheY-like chemotaxis protein